MAKNKPNSKLIIEFDSFSLEYDVTWINNHIAEGEDIAEKIFFEPTQNIDDAFLNDEYPEMTIYFNEDANVKSQVVFDSEAGMLFSAKTLEHAKTRTNTNKNQI